MIIGLFEVLNWRQILLLGIGGVDPMLERVPNILNLLFNQLLLLLFNLEFSFSIVSYSQIIEILHEFL